ncbi:TaqI family restriction endonuclease [Candidatus Chrysopegis kryptomonas]|uniref:TaqI restriction endonuclease n=1 Tax=Candidatus Chryseopegocella kryptomonas TaxID=1633643 RepID=A0A0N7MWQ8_9BACT|nr:TaqI family restriction endonuclease [Candidatus Chrysopegis kryptomonas]CUS99323.1 TaqI restriction endonuclease [Candidatus Chrysopegis kryptomonas]
MTRNWKEDLNKFENFLGSIDMQKYAYLREIKTVEQDLPKDLLPLEIYYRYYWDTTDFKDYDEIFEIYWSEKLNPCIYNFIKKYFYGCSLQFVEEGFKARLYRIWMSILTQFHFQYLWNALFDDKLVSTPELDMMGMDAILDLNEMKIAIQVKKVSYRREASQRGFTKKQRTYADIIVEAPYLVIDIDEIENKIANSKVGESKKNEYINLLRIFEENFSKLENGFIIFNEKYLNHVREVILDKLKVTEKGEKITYDEILKW